MGWETVIIALITSGGVTAGVELIKFFVKRSDDKHDKKDRIQAEQKKQGETLSRVATGCL